MSPSIILRYSSDLWLLLKNSSAASRRSDPGLTLPMEKVSMRHCGTCCTNSWPDRLKTLTPSSSCTKLTKSAK